ncbi:MAG: ferrous iron transport protein B [Thermoproteota archaeon]
MIVALAGSPNVGKSALFNALTGKAAHVANWPGVTVDMAVAVVSVEGSRLCIVDLPGTYGLSATSLDEEAARNFILEGVPDAIVVVADATAPERTLYLAVQILELTPRVVVALNKADMAHSLGIHVNVKELERRLGVPVIAVSALQGLGLDDLLEAAARVSRGEAGGRLLRIDYGALEPFIAELEKMLAPHEHHVKVPARWLAVKLLEGDEKAEEIARAHGLAEVVDHAHRLRARFRAESGTYPEDIATAARFDYTERLLRGAVVRVHVGGGSRLVEAVEAAFRQPVVGPLVSLITLFLLFTVVFAVNIGFPLNVLFELLGYSNLAAALEKYSLSGLMGMLFDVLAAKAEVLLAGRVPEALAGLVVDGIITGVGSVLSFLPLIVTVSAMLAALEDSGLAPRIAASLHGLFEKLGVSGRALFPMMVSMGCNVPGVMSTRGIPEGEERVSVALSTPFVTCQARLVVLLAFLGAYLASPFSQALAVLLIYMTGALLALVTAGVFRRLLFGRTESPELVIELPPLHRPSGKVVWWTTWSYSKGFLRKAAGIIFVLSMAVWALTYYGPSGTVSDPAESFGAMLGRVFEPAARALWGISGDQAWKVVFAAINGFAAKEVVVETIAIVQGIEDPIAAVRSLGLTVPQAMGFLVFLMLYVPCMATVAVMYQETKRGKYVIAAVLYMVAVASAFSAAVYRLLELAA